MASESSSGKAGRGAVAGPRSKFDRGVQKSPKMTGTGMGRGGSLGAKSGGKPSKMRGSKKGVGTTGLGRSIFG